ncbi:hypothetical protein LAZ40_09815 [Cereibacter sphaeroides]|uniref:hypothetical protein n=1 Tax=Cereibacter sphaeroides TaxID=1063 RepID=UPI001F22B482|nr:hypothetical protein [Cereibacter sphaeroides]MCE6959347.1 hypothetical protein [Cereibacter sphaeroides]MCE6972939.1 hypothetical protein [Cereibacter sphaeroides]
MTGGTPVTILSRALRRMRRARHFPENTCPASRQAQIIAEDLAAGRVPPVIAEEPEHAALSLAATVAALWEARDQLARLGYEYRTDRAGRSAWRQRQD